MRSAGRTNTSLVRLEGHAQYGTERTAAAVTFRPPADYGPHRAEQLLIEQFEVRGLIGFGGGVHICPGRRFAYTAMKVILSQLLSRYRAAACSSGCS